MTCSQGLGDQFPRSVRWAPLAQPGHWPDADLLAIGFLGPAPGWGKARYTRLTRAEQRAYLTLWCTSRSPLMLGANLTRLDAWTRALLTHPEVLATDQLPCEQLGLARAAYRRRDLWSAQVLGAAASLRARLPPRGAALYRIFAQ